jgi:two-component system, OmpR family, phosphate regulon sensor histidine kinase PhoR
MSDVRAAHPSSADAPRLETALAHSFELVAGVALLGLIATAVIVVLIPRSTTSRTVFAIELVFLGLALVVLALLLSRRSARAVVRPLEVLDDALAAITAGDLAVQVQLPGAAAEIQSVGDSVNTMVIELARLRVVEADRIKDHRVRRELAEVVHASLDVDRIVQRAVEVVGDALGVDRVHIRLRGRDAARLAAEWLRSSDIASVRVVSPADEVFAILHLIGITDDGRAVVIDDAHDPEKFRVEQRLAFEESSVRAALTYPITIAGHVGGVLVASEQRAPREWTDEDVALMEGFAREIGRALDHARAFELQNQMVERLALLDRSKNDFLAEVSRELRGPLASVLGYIELLTDDSADAVSDEQRHMLGIVERSGEKLLVLISNLLLMSRMEAGTFEPALALVDVEGMVIRVCDSLTPAVTQGQLVVEVNLEPGLELVADEGQVERALHNLVANAVKYTPAGGHIDISTRSESDSVVIAVRDTGIGVAEDEQDDLFSRFFSSKTGPRRETLGTGLVLYIVKKIVDGHDGSVGVLSLQGRGSTFTMRYPVARDSALIATQNRGKP